MAAPAADCPPHGASSPAAAHLFFTRGYCVLPAVLAPAHVAALLDDVARDLASLVNAESGGGGAKQAPIVLADARTWPQGRARRVAECAPADGSREYWRALRAHAPLRHALDAIMGAGTWHLPLNEADAHGRLVGPRHWYAPVVLSESAGGGGGGALGDDVTQACPGPRRALFASSLDELRAHGPATDATAHARWQPVSRRRFCNKGWHLDAGPGFSPHAPRDMSTHDPAQDQGAVLLLLLTDWAPGGGGTALLPYSHLWVARELVRRSRGDGGGDSSGGDGGGGGGDDGGGDGGGGGARRAYSHEQLNTHFVQRLRHATEVQGRVVLACGCGDPAHATADATAAAAAAPAALTPGRGCCDSGEEAGAATEGGGDEADDAGEEAGASLHNDIDGHGAIVVEQVVGRAGDVVLMHPLLLHSGTANMRSAPRVMANGMARVLPAAFAPGGPGSSGLVRGTLEALARASSR